MAKYRILAAAALQIVGIDGQAEHGDQIGTIETDCDIGSLISCLNYGGARVEPIIKGKRAASLPDADDSDADDSDADDSDADDSDAGDSEQDGSSGDGSDSADGSGSAEGSNAAPATKTKRPRRGK